MPKHRYNYSQNTDMYTASYEQYYFKDARKKVKPLKRKQKNKGNIVQKTISLAFFAILLFGVFPYSFKNFIADVFPHNPKKMLNIDYEK